MSKERHLYVAFLHLLFFPSYMIDLFFPSYMIDLCWRIGRPVKVERVWIKFLVFEKSMFKEKFSGKYTLEDQPVQRSP